MHPGTQDSSFDDRRSYCLYAEAWSTTSAFRIEATIQRLFPAALLLVVLDNSGWTYFRFVGIIPELSKCPALAQQIPALV